MTTGVDRGDLMLSVIEFEPSGETGYSDHSDHELYDSPTRSYVEHIGWEDAT